MELRLAMTCRQGQALLWIVVAAVAILIAGCGGGGAAPPSVPPNGSPFALSIVTTSASPLSLVLGQTGAISVTAETSYYATTWSVQAVYVAPAPPAALCAAVVPGPPTSSGFPFTITTTTNGAALSHPCTQQIEFEANPQPSPTSTASPVSSASMTSSPSPMPQWSAMLWVTIQPAAQPFTLSAQTSPTDPLTLILGQTGAVTVTAVNSLYLSTWSVQAVYVSPSPSSSPCAEVVPSSPSSTGFPFSLVTSIGSSNTPLYSSYPCKQQIEFEAYPEPSPGSTPSPMWSSNLWVQVEPTP
jgi:hypothetical protein